MAISKAIRFIGRQKYRFTRGQGYIGIINTLLLLGLVFHITDIWLIIGVGLGTLAAVWLVGLADDRLKIVHAETTHQVEETTPYFQRLDEKVDFIVKYCKKEK